MQKPVELDRIDTDAKKEFWRKGLQMLIVNAANGKAPGRQFGKSAYEPGHRQPGSHVPCRKCGLVLLPVNQIRKTMGLCADCRRN